MKVKYVMLALMATGLLSCDKILNNNGKIWDIAPVVFRVEVIDADGVDLLNPENRNSLNIDGINAFYRGAKYECNKDVSISDTKAYMPYFYGLKVRKQYSGNTYILEFGELAGDKDYPNEEVAVFWGDGTWDVIRVNRKFRWKLNGDPDINDKWYLNDVIVPEGVIRIVK